MNRVFVFFAPMARISIVCIYASVAFMSTGYRHLCAMEKVPLTCATRAPAELQDTFGALPGTIPEPPTPASLTDTQNRFSGRRGRRRSVCCVFTRQDTQNSLAMLANSAGEQYGQGQELPLGRRLSVALSEISSHASEERAQSPAENPESADRRNSLTSQLSVELSPHEKDDVEAAIEDIRRAQDPISKAEKQNLLLLNVTFKQFGKITKLFDSVAASIARGNQQTLAQVQATAAQTQQNLQKLETGTQEMREAQKRQRKLYYLSFGVGICGFGLFLTNFITQQLQKKDCQS